MMRKLPTGGELSARRQNFQRQIPSDGSALAGKSNFYMM
jgi:hypothetical protein